MVWRKLNSKSKITGSDELAIEKAVGFSRVFFVLCATLCAGSLLRAKRILSVKMQVVRLIEFME
jgi:hypothetical protein